MHNSSIFPNKSISINYRHRTKFVGEDINHFFLLEKKEFLIKYGYKWQSFISISLMQKATSQHSDPAITLYRLIEISVYCLRLSLPETMHAKWQSKFSSLVSLTIHDWGNHFCVLYNDCHLTVTLPQHATVINIGRTWKDACKWLIILLVEE